MTRPWTASRGLRLEAALEQFREIAVDLAAHEIEAEES